MKRILFALTISAGLMLAQPSQQTPSFTEVKAALGLTDAQVTSLQQIRTASGQAIQPIAQQMQTKRTTLQTSLAAGTTAQAAGTLLLEIEALRKQIDTIQTNGRNQALGVLSADQKTKLKVLDDAAKLRPAIQQATALNLLTPVEPAAGFGGPGFGPGAAGGPMGGGGMMGVGPRGPRGGQ